MRDRLQLVGLRFGRAAPPGPCLESTPSDFRGQIARRPRGGRAGLAYDVAVGPILQRTLWRARGLLKPGENQNDLFVDLAHFPLQNVTAK